jgi:hypothetical protein
MAERRCVAAKTRRRHDHRQADEIFFCGIADVGRHRADDNAFIDLRSERLFGAVLR